MTAQESEVLYKLVQQVEDMKRQLDKNTQDTQAIRTTLDNLSGGKQALMWFTGITLTVAGLVIAYIGLNHTK